MSTAARCVSSMWRPTKSSSAPSDKGGSRASGTSTSCVNNKIDPTFDVVENATIPVGARSLVHHSQARGAQQRAQRLRLRGPQQDRLPPGLYRRRRAGPARRRPEGRVQRRIHEPTSTISVRRRGSPRARGTPCRPLPMRTPCNRCQRNRRAPPMARSAMCRRLLGTGG